MPVTTRSQTTPLHISKVQLCKQKLMKCVEGFEIIDIMDEMPSIFGEYRIQNAQYDETFYKIPYNIFYAKTNMTIQELIELESNIENYTGSIYLLGDTVMVDGGD